MQAGGGFDLHDVVQAPLGQIGGLAGQDLADGVHGPG